MEKRRLIDTCFIACELFLYILIFTSAPIVAKIASYISIVLSFAYTLTFIEYRSNRKVKLLQLGLLFTLIADFFLVLLGSYKEAAMISFSATQISYALLLNEYSRHAKIDGVIRIIGSVGTLIITYIVLKNNIDFLSLISMFYYFNLVINAIISFIYSPSLAFKMGLVLFICCDTVIGLQNLGGYLYVESKSILYTIIYPSFNLPWVFYLPSQVLISLSINSIIKEATQEELVSEIVSKV